MRTLCGIFVVFGLLAAEIRGGDWPAFRGPHGDGHADAGRLPTTWGGTSAPSVWETVIPGRGWSSPIVIGDRVWLTYGEELALSDTARQKRLASNPFGSEDFHAHAAVTLYAIELALDTGKILRQLELFTSENPAPIHVANSYASPTPVTDGERLYCHFGSLGTVAVDLASGAVVWKQVFAQDDITGAAGSPVLWSDHLIFTCDGFDQQFVVALDRRTGEIAWRTPRPPIQVTDGKLRRTFSTPLVIEYAGRSQLIAPAAQWLVSYDPATGNEWWRARIATGYSIVPRPVFRDGLVYVCSGYMRPELWAVRADGTGDVSATHVAWTFKRQVPEIASPIVVGEQIYFVSVGGVATSLRAADGKFLWQHRLTGSYSASPLAADGKLYFTNEEGLTTVVVPGPEYRELAQNQLVGRTRASLAVAGESLLMRSDPVLYCIRATPAHEVAP